MKKNNFLILGVLLVLVGCREDSHNEIQTTGKKEFISGYNLLSMDPDIMDPDITNPFAYTLIKLTNDGTHYTKKSYTHPLIHSEISIDSIYYDIKYGQNLVSIELKSTPRFYLEKYKKLIKFNKDKITEIINLNDSLIFEYKGDVLHEVTHLKNGPWKKHRYYFNSAGNLDSIVTRPGSLKTNREHKPYYVYNIDNETSKIRDIQVYSNYDNAENPLKELGIFDEVFIRSLSKNNYRKYQKFSVNFFIPLNKIDTVSRQEQTWDFKYLNGKPVF